MSTENDFRTPWDAQRIAELRELAQDSADATNREGFGPVVTWATERLHKELSGYSVLSLLDELERVRQESEARRRAVVALERARDEVMRQNGDLQDTVKALRKVVNAPVPDGD